MNVRQTSIETYKRIVSEGLLSKRRWQVYEALYHNGPSTGAQIAAIVKKSHGSWGHSETIRNRLTELRDMQCISELGTTLDPISGNTVILWATNDNLPTKMQKSNRPSRKELETALERAIRMCEQLGKNLFYCSSIDYRDLNYAREVFDRMKK